MYSLSAAVSIVLGHVVMTSLIRRFFCSLTVLAAAMALTRILSILSGCSRQAFCLYLVRLSLRRTQPLRALVRLGLVIAVNLRTR